MSVTITSCLNPSQKKQIQSLDSAFPMDDADLFALFETDHLIRSAAAFIKEDEATYECYAYTAPDFRHEGMFSALLDAVIDELPEDVEFLFYTNGTDADCMATLHALEAELVMEEHMMEIRLCDYRTEVLPMTSAFAQSNSDSPPTDSASTMLPLTIRSTDIDGTLTWQYENSNGTVKISVFSSYYYLYGFEIREELRGKGLGTKFLHQVLTDLAEKNPLPLRLQVSGDNLPALSLYKKTGFRITETLSGYLY